MVKRVYIVLAFVLYLKNSVTIGTSFNSSSYNSKNANNPQWYTNGQSSISRESYADPAPNQLQAYPTSFDNGAASASEYNNVIPSETSKYYYKIYPGAQQNQPQYYQQSANGFQQYPNSYSHSPDEVSNKQSFFDGLSLPSLGSLGSSFGGLSSLFGGGGGDAADGGGILQSFGGGGGGFPGLGGGGGGFPGLGGGGGEYGGDIGGGGLSGLGSAAGPAITGIFGLKGLKKLGVFGTIILLFVLGPVLIVLIGFPIAMIVLGVLAFPVLQLRLPPQRRRSLGASLSDTTRFARDVLQSEECVERLSCNIANYTRSLPFQGWITSKLERSSNKWLHRVSRSMQVAHTGAECSKFTCTHALSLSGMFRKYVFGEGKSST